MSIVLQFVITGIAVGAVYGLVALGFVIIYNVTGVVNFAQGTFPMLGGFIMVSFAGAHLPLPPAIVLDALIVAGVGLTFCALAVLPFREARIPPLIVTLGLSLSFEGIAFFVWSFNPLSYPPFSGSQAMFFLGAAVYPQTLWVIGVVVLLVVLVYAFFEMTFLGKAVRACALNRRAARLIGIDIHLMAFIAFGLSAATGAVAGAVITPLIPVTFTSDVNLAVNGFAGAIFGGLENPMAAVAGGMLLGVVGELAKGYIGNGFDIVAALVLMLVVLISRPQGVFANLFTRRAAV
jgi:branched-chain amino acid transport system permease protein